MKNRLHLCLQPQRPREEEVERLVVLGASNIDFIAGTAAIRLTLGPTGAVGVADGRSIPRVAD